MTDKLELRSSHEVIYTVNVADVESIFYCKPTDPDILTVLMSDGKRLYCDEVCPVYSLQEEPKFKTGDRIKPIDSCLGSPRIIEEVCDSWYVTDQGTLDFEFEDNWELVEEPVSEDLEKEMDNYLPTVFSKDVDGGEPRFTTWFKALRKTAIYFAKWQKQQMMKDAIETDILGDGTGWLSFGYLPECEYDFKEKEKVKLIIIKED